MRERENIFWAYMNRKEKNYRSLITEHEEAGEQYTRFKFRSVTFQTAIFLIVGLLKYLEVQRLYLCATVLLAVLVLLRVRSFLFARAHDQSMSQRILEGVKLEKNSSQLDGFFHECLKQFGLLGVIVTMAKRAVPDLCALGLFGIALYRLVLEIDPSFSLSLKSIYLILPILGWVVGGLYYKPLEPLMLAQREIYAH